jgi:hypothetical protein
MINKSIFNVKRFRRRAVKLMVHETQTKICSEDFTTTPAPKI